MRESVFVAYRLRIASEAVADSGDRTEHDRTHPQTCTERQHLIQLDYVIEMRLLLA